MRQSLLLFAMGALVLAGGASAQRHEIPTLNSCIKELYDPGMYNWLTFQNNCTQAVTVTFLAKDGSEGGGSMDLRPGARDSVGTQHGQKPKIGSFELYVCELGSVPLDESGKVVNKVGSSFKCGLKP